MLGGEKPKSGHNTLPPSNTHTKGLCMGKGAFSIVLSLVDPSNPGGNLEALREKSSEYQIMFLPYSVHH